MVQVVKDKKGACYIVSHRRCGVTECLFLTVDELRELKEIIEKVPIVLKAAQRTRV